MALSKIQNNSFADLAVHGRRRINLNGAMTVAQRGTSFTGKTGSTYAIDRYETKISSAGTWTLSQSTTAPSGFNNSYKVECTVANSSLSASSLMLIQQRLEGQDLAHLKKGTSGAEKVTLSFWVRSDKTGTYVLEIQDLDNTRHIATTYSISASDTWEHKTITFDGDTSGALTHDNSPALEFNFWLVAGTDYSSGTLATSWASTTDANRAAGQLNLADTVGNEFYITGIQMEIGDTSTSFEHRSYNEELNLCYRYLQVFKPDGQDYTNFGAAMGTTSSGVFFVPIHLGGAGMRTDPSLTISSADDFRTTSQFSNTDVCTGVIIGYNNPKIPNLQVTSGNSGAGVTRLFGFSDDTDAYMFFDAEM